jgi:ribosomal RNA assembly protein
MFQDQLKINKERLPILIGKNGGIKKRLESRTSTKIIIDSKEGDVFIKGEDSYGVFVAKTVVLAVSRGFNPDIALMLTTEEFVLEVINIKDFSGKSKDKERTSKSRIIGTKGKVKQLLERLTNTDISVYGKTVSIIGKIENALMARRAVEMILKGSKQGNAYSWLERQNQQNRELKHNNDS